MSTITWIIIVLIVISIAVTVTEVGLRFGILERGKSERGKIGAGVQWANGMELRGRNFSSTDFDGVQLRAICGAGIVPERVGEL